MYYLAEVFPWLKGSDWLARSPWTKRSKWLRKIRLDWSRDQVMLLMAAVNLIFIGVDIYLAHDMDGIIKPNEWIPIIFGPVAGILLLIAGLVAIRNRLLANSIASVIFLGCITVAALGSYFHLHYAMLPDAPPGEQVTARLMMLAPPMLGPLTFALVAFLGLSAAWEEDPVDSGVLVLLGSLRVKMPYSKSRAYFFMTALFIMATVVSSVLDHARTNFANPWLWLPTFAGVFAMVVTAAMGTYGRLTRSDLVTFIATMGLMVVVGLVGAVLHIQNNLVGQGAFLTERFLRGAPGLAPLLFANMGALGMIVLLDPKPGKVEPDA
jgi:hypothetical protein